MNFEGESDLLFIPHIHGERAPFWNSHLTGEWLGLTASHGKEDLIEATIEGILFNLYDVYNLLSSSAGPIKALTVSGGFFQNKKVIQVVADLFGLPIYLNQTFEQTSLGAAMIAHDQVLNRDTRMTKYLLDDGRDDYYQRKYNDYQRVLKHVYEWLFFL